MGIIKSFIITGIAIFVLARLLPSVSYLNLTTLIVASIVLTLLQKIVRPILKVLLLPINIITLGLFSWIINVIILWLLIALVPGFHIDPVNFLGLQLGPFMSLVFVSLVLGFIQSAVDIVI